MASPGDVVVVRFQGAAEIKRRPAVVASSALYHQHRPDHVVGVLTSQVQSTTAPVDYVLQDWSVAGLHQPSAFRSYFNTVRASDVVVIGRLSDRDWQGVRQRLARTFGFTV